MFHEGLEMLFLDMGEDFEGVFFTIIPSSVHVFLLSKVCMIYLSKKKKSIVLPVMCNMDESDATLEGYTLHGRVLH